MHKDGFTLVEVLMACSLLGLVLLPALGALRAQLSAIERLETRERVHVALEGHLEQMASDLRAGRQDDIRSGFRRDGLLVRSSPPEMSLRGDCRLWLLEAEVIDADANFRRHGLRWLLLRPPGEGEEDSSP